MQRGLVAAVLVGVVCAVMGTFVVLEGLAFIGDAVSHAAFPGLVIAYIVGLPLYVGGAIAAVGTALAIGWVARRGGAPLRYRGRRPVRRACSPLASSSSARSRATSADLFGYLLGNVLGITFDGHRPDRGPRCASCWSSSQSCARSCCTRPSIQPGAAASGLPVERLEYLLLGLIGVTIVVSIQAVGIIMVVAMLVTPAATGQLRRLDGSGTWSRSRSASRSSPRSRGLYLSFYLNVASGASIVLVETLLFTIALLFSPKSGWLLRRARPTTSALIVGPTQDT